MSEMDFANADREVIRMVNRGHGPGGELPSVTRTFIPSDRVAKAEALDQRLQELQRIVPYVCAALSLLAGFLIGRGV